MAQRVAGGRWIENRARSGLRGVDPSELWAYRELAAFLAVRDLKVRYKQAFFGVTWALLQPLAGAVVFTVVFHRLADVGAPGTDYPLFAYAGLLVWGYHASTVGEGMRCLVTDSALVTKVYFPRVLAPLATGLPGLVDLVVGLVVFAVMMVVYGEAPPAAIVTLPLCIVAMVTLAVGISLWLSTLYVQYRDIGHATALAMQLWLFVSPVAYPSTLVHGGWRTVYYLNPVAGIVDWFRWATLGTTGPGWHLATSLAVTAALVVGGVLFFQQAERRFADVI